MRVLAAAAIALFTSAPPLAVAVEESPLVIAHRGASGYLPEHTLESKVMAFMMGADYLEQDVVLTKDDLPLVLHDLYLDAVTDVGERFPGRARDDGHHYAIDFTLAELRTLHVRERVHPGTGEARYPQRFPSGASHFRLHTLDEEIELVRALDARFGRRTGLHVELKDPEWHEAAGKDIAAVVIETLERHGYRSRTDNVFIQSFDSVALERLAAAGNELPRIQLIGENRWGIGSRTNHARLMSPAGLARIAGYADGVGLWLGHIVDGIGPSGGPRLSSLVERARAHDLAVHVYTLRQDDLPPGVADFDALLELVYDTLGADGAFTDFPDLARAFLDR